LTFMRTSLPELDAPIKIIAFYDRALAQSHNGRPTSREVTEPA
jgi:hypothetical protein